MDDFDYLDFAITYAREKQVERLTAHLVSGKSIPSFTYNAAEYHLDSIYEYYMNKKREDEKNIESTKNRWYTFKK